MYLSSLTYDNGSSVRILVNGKGELFGIERTESILLQSRGAEDFIGKLKAALTVFSGGKFSDDITAIAFDL